MSKKSIIFIAIAVVLVIVGFSSKNTSKQTDAISGAVYVEDGKVLPENEGKIVIVPGKAEAIEPLVDTLTGVPIPHIKASRTVEIYEERMETNEENNSTYYVFDWKSTTHSGVNKFDEVHSTNLVANCKVGEFEIDGQIINGISVGKKLKDIDNQAIAAKGYREHYEHKKDITYVAKLDYMPTGGERSGSKAGYKQGYYSDYEGAHRVSYTIPSEESLEYTFIGKQQNGKIMYDKDLGMQAAFSGLQNPTELAERVESGGKIGAYVAWGIAAFFILLAFVLGKKKKEN
jgi:hypothetical protein